MRVFWAAGAVLLAASAFGQGKRISRDQPFVDEADSLLLGEIDAGALAERKAASEPVRALAAEVKRDHRAAVEGLHGVAADKDLFVPNRLQDPEVLTYQRLDRLSGRRFDEAYVAHVVADERLAARAFAVEAGVGRDRELRAYAAEALPRLRANEARAQGELARLRACAE